MTNKTTGQPSAAVMLHEAQGYRTSLEALMSVGRTMLLNPSLEDDAASSFKVLAEDVLEQADHQGDLQVVDGVTEPSAQVELIMQDVLTPRLMEVEQIEKALQAKADADEPVPFTTRDAETSASLESAFRVEALDLFLDNVATVRTVASLEGMTADALRPHVMNVARRIGDDLHSIGVSMEDLEQTQVLGDMADAVTRIENLVSTAKQQAEESAEAARNNAQAIGGDEGDRMGDLIEQYRQDNPSGPKLKDGVQATTIEKDTPSSDLGEEGVDDGVEPEQGDGEEGTDLDLDESGEEGLDDGNDLDLPIDDLAGAEEDPDVDTAGGELEEEALEEEADLEEESEEEEIEEEEEDEDTPSTESNVDPIVFENLSNRMQDVDTVQTIMGELMNWLDANGLLTADGQAALQAGVDGSFKLDSSMVVAHAGEVLARHYDTWIAACIRDNETNTRALSVLMGV